MSITTPLEESFNKFLHYRIDEIAKDIIKNPKHIALNNECLELTSKLKENVTKKDWGFLCELEAIESRIAIIENKSYYQEGIKDGIELRSILVNKNGRLLTVGDDSI